MKLYAVGDIHGELGKLQAALTAAGLIGADLVWSGLDATLVCTGDYIDRGPDSKGVIDFLIKLASDATAAGGKVVTLWGNHERMMFDGAYDENAGENWLMNGGRDCAISYGLGMMVYAYNYTAKVTHAIMKVHGDFFSQLKEYHIEGDTLFVHAGLDPRGTADTIGFGGDILHLWIRNPFFQKADPKDYLAQNYGVERVVFGHTVHRGVVTPYFDGKYLCIDTGSFLEDGCVSVVELSTEGQLSWRLAGQGR